MTKEQFDAIISLANNVVIVSGGTVTAVFAVIKFFDMQKTRLAEKSVGASKIKELEKRDEEREKVTQKLLEKIENLEELLTVLNEKYDKLIDKVWDFFKK